MSGYNRSKRKGSINPRTKRNQSSASKAERIHIWTVRQESNRLARKVKRQQRKFG